MKSENWSDNELLAEIRDLGAAIDVLEKLGERYALVVSDLILQRSARDLIRFHRNLEAVR